MLFQIRPGGYNCSPLISLAELRCLKVLPPYGALVTEANTHRNTVGLLISGSIRAIPGCTNARQRNFVNNILIVLDLLWRSQVETLRLKKYIVSFVVNVDYKTPDPSVRQFPCFTLALDNWVRMTSLLWLRHNQIDVWRLRQALFFAKSVDDD